MLKIKTKVSKYFAAALILGIVGLIFFEGNAFKNSTAKVYNKSNFKAEKKYEFKMLRDPETNRIPANIRQLELKFAKTLPEAREQRLKKGINKIQTLSWTTLGPANQGGRTRAIAVDVSQNNVILAGGVSGGMWRSTDYGGTWVKTTKPEQLQSVSCIAQDTRQGHTNVFYYGTGEFAGNSASTTGAYYLGNGIFKSIDDGLTWNLLASTSANTPQIFSSAFDIVWNIAIDPSNTNQDVVYAAIYGEIMRSTDGGGRWSNVLGNINSAYTDVAVTNSGVVYAALSSSSDTASGIWRSATGLKGSFTRITPAGWPSNYNRIVLGLAPSNQKILYVIAETPGAGKLGHSLWKYTDGAANPWTDLSNQIPALGKNGDFTSQSSYDLLLKVKPDDENFVVIGGTNLYRSTDGFSTAIDTNGWIGGYSHANDNSNYPNNHPDQHSLVFLPSNPKVMYSGNDGGISKTTDNTATPVVWQHSDHGYITSQFYSVSMDMSASNDSMIVGGLQDNGNYYYDSDKRLGNWNVLPFGGDGGFTAVADNKTSIYIETQNGNVERLISNSNNYATVKPKGASNFLFIAPFTLDPNNTNVMYMPANDTLWRNSDLTGIPLNSDKPTSVNWSPVASPNSGGNVISAVSVSTTPANIVYFGNAAGSVYKIADGSAASPVITDITGSNFPDSAYVSCIAVDPTNANNVMVVFSNYSVISLFYSNDGGTSWTDVAGNLEQNPDGSGNGPSCRWASILHNKNILYFFVATSTGLYSTPALNGINTVWSQEGPNSIGNIVCTMVKTRSTDAKLLVATHGNGVYESNMITLGVKDLSTDKPGAFALAQNYPNPFNPVTKIRYSILNVGMHGNASIWINVYDILGKKIATLVNKRQQPGNYEVTFDGSGLASGVYFYTLRAGSYTDTRKMILMK